MLRKGIHCIKVRTSVNVSDVGMPILPPIFRLFLKSFVTGKNGLDLQYFNYTDELIQLTCINYEKKLSGESYENSIAYFFTLEDLRKELDKYEKQSEEFYKMGFVRIGFFDIADSILLKTENDELWKLNGDWGEPKPYVEKISNNIFEFLHDCRESVIMMNLFSRKVKIGQLYKNWNEDFWRIKNEE